jgi:hypothetical protein
MNCFEPLVFEVNVIEEFYYFCVIVVFRYVRYKESYSLLYKP